MYMYSTLEQTPFHSQSNNSVCIHGTLSFRLALLILTYISFNCYCILLHVSAIRLGMMVVLYSSILNSKSIKEHRYLSNNAADVTVDHSSRLKKVASLLCKFNELPQILPFFFDWAWYTTHQYGSLIVIVAFHHQKRHYCPLDEIVSSSSKQAQASSCIFVYGYRSHIERK